jgi:hypothetical protein
LQRGTCNFSVKIHNATAAGAIGALVFNEGQANRVDPIEPSLGPGEIATIPWFFTSFEVGNDLATLLNSYPTSVIVRMRTEETDTTAPSGGPGAVPEPSAWAMMLLGFGFVGGAMRSAKRRKGLTVSYA